MPEVAWCDARAAMDSTALGQSLLSIRRVSTIADEVLMIWLPAGLVLIGLRLFSRPTLVSARIESDASSYLGACTDSSDPPRS
jgi:hypothetical protein